MFSVIIPLYNKQDSISSTLMSVIHQSFLDLEIIVVDDGSTDDSLSQVKKINDSRIRIISQLNGGVSSARNCGIRSATYDWIALLDGDDLWKTNHLEHMNDLIEKFPGKQVFSSSFVYSTNQSSDVLIVQNQKLVSNYFEEAFNEHFLWSSAIVFHRDCINNVGGFNESLSRGEDLDLWARIGRKYEIVRSNLVTAIYRLDAENRACTTKTDLNRSIVSIINFKGMCKDERKYFQKLIRSKILNLLSDKDYRNAFYLVLRYNINLIY